MYFNLYSAISLTKLMNQIEEENNFSIRVSAYHELSSYCCSRKYQNFWKILLISIYTFVNCATVVTIVINATYFVHHDIWGVDTRIIKLIIMGIGMLILFLTIVPENYKYLAVPIFLIIALIFVIVTAKILDYTITDHYHIRDTVTHSLFKWDSLLLSLSMSNSSFNLSQIFCVRNTMKHPRKLGSLTTWAGLILLCAYIVSGFLCYMAFGDEFLQPDSLFYFPGNKLFFVLNCILNIALVAWFPFIIITVLEQIEY